jgi:hypothetical protein
MFEIRRGGWELSVGVVDEQSLFCLGSVFSIVEHERWRWLRHLYSFVWFFFFFCLLLVKETAYMGSRDAEKEHGGVFSLVLALGLEASELVCYIDTRLYRQSL